METDLKTNGHFKYLLELLIAANRDKNVDEYAADRDARELHAKEDGHALSLTIAEMLSQRSFDQIKLVSFVMQLCIVQMISFDF